MSIDVLIKQRFDTIVSDLFSLHKGFLPNTVTKFREALSSLSFSDILCSCKE